MINIYHKKMNGMWYAAAIEGDSVYTTSFAWEESDVLKHMLGNLPFKASFQMAEKHIQLSDKLLEAVKSVFEGENVSTDFKLEMSHLSPYSQKVLRLLAKVPVGYVTTYNALAKAMGGGPRAVGRVMATNPFAPLVPCHRVVCSDFSLGGFGSGVDVKQEMLQREERGYREPSKIKADGAVLTIFPVCFLWKD